jgi:hypothetical protein
MIFNADLHVRIFGLAPHGFEDLDGLLDVPIDAAVTISVSPAAEIAPRHRASESPGCTDQEAGVIFGLAPLLPIVRVRGGADASRTGLKLNPRTFGLGPDFSQVALVQALVNVEVGQQKRIDLQPRGILDQSRRLPAEGPDREVVKAQPESLCSGRGESVRRASG